MKFPKLALFIALFSPVLISTAYAQRGGGHGGGGGHAGGGMSHSSGGGFRGGSVGGFRGGTVGGFRGGVGGFRGGFGGGRGYYYGGRYYGPSVYLGGWGYPYYGYSGYYGYDPYSYGYDPYAYDDYSTYAPAPAQQAQPGYQSYGYPQQGYPQQPQVQTAPQQAPIQTQPQSTTGNAQEQAFYLIAFNDHTIQAATAYKVDGDQIHWMTRDGQERQAPLSSVDVRFSQQINRDRHVDFQIP